MRESLLAALVAAVLLAGCGADASTAAAPAPPSSTSTTRVSAPAPPTTTTAPPEIVDAVCQPWAEDPVAPEAAPLTAVLAAHLDDPRLEGVEVSTSVWVDGLGEVLAHHPEDPLLVASNQKLLTAMGLLEVVPLDATLRTGVVAGPGTELSTGVVDGDLTLVAGGDPELTSTGPHSLTALAEEVRAAGVTEVRGGLVVDDSRYGSERAAPGWQDWHIPAYTGPLSALVVDDNRGRSDPAFLAEPALGHGEAFRDRLAAVGVRVAGPVVTVGAAPADGVAVADLDSAPVGDLMATMLLSSDNEVAESLTREAGVLLDGDGSTPDGTAALEARLLDGCAPLTPGAWADGSGMSRSDRRSAREMRRLVQHAQAQEWWTDLESRLPVAGQSGTLAGRFRGTAAEGRVVAKTGTIIGGVTLTGIVTTAGGREGVFSILINGDGSTAARGALDDLVIALAAS
ncbi:MAG: D-alanyl-D-alanine carboxypeptidase/D-alanyl-D-alanine endopeptidase [Iamia sp.]